MAGEKKPNLQRNFMGLDGWIWAIGRVEDRTSDPFKLGRCKVRYLGIHPEDKKELPTDELPWSYPLQSIDSGRSTVGLKEGDWVLAFFMDGIVYQQPVVLGVLPGAPDRHANPDLGFNDPRPNSWLSGHRIPRDPLSWPDQRDDGSGTRFKEISPKSRYPQCEHADPNLAYIENNEPQSTSRFERSERIKETIVESKKLNVKIGQTNIPTADHAASNVGTDTTSPGIYWTETKTPYGTRYPYNHAYWSEGGHLLEVDDTPGKERIHIYHRASTFFEIHPNGSTVFKCANTEQHITLADRLTHIENHDFLTIDKAFKLLVNKDKGPNNCDITVDQGGNCNLTLKGGNLNVFVQQGDVNAKVVGSLGLDVTGSIYVTAGQDIKVQSGQNYYETAIGNRTSVTVGNNTNMVMGSRDIVTIGMGSETVIGVTGKDYYGATFINYHATLKTTNSGVEQKINSDNWTQLCAQNWTLDVGTVQTAPTGGNILISCQKEMNIIALMRFNLSTLFLDLATAMSWIKATVYMEIKTLGIMFLWSSMFKNVAHITAEEYTNSGVHCVCWHCMNKGGPPVPIIPQIPEKPFVPQVYKTLFGLEKVATTF